MTMTVAKSALIVASFEYEDPKFRELRAPVHDAEALARVLRNPEVGNFSVQSLINEPYWVINEAIEEFFSERNREDFLLLYFSCHGVKDQRGRLYFATKNTKFQRLAATGVSSVFVNEQIDTSRSRRKVLLLDCCYSGAFARGFAPKAAASVEIKEPFRGRGLAIITASDAMEYAWEEDQLRFKDSQPSVFTNALVHGLETGEADWDEDGLISIGDLYEYLVDSIQGRGISQRPTIFTHFIAGEVIIANSIREVSLPSQILRAVESNDAVERLGAVIPLAQLMATGRRVADRARQALERLRDTDDDGSVRMAANAALKEPERAHNVVLQEERRQRERIEQELRVAQLIQQQFLPQELPDLPGWQVGAYYGPAREVGGDFYDLIRLPSGQLGIVVGDVTDKGVPAALVMATTHAILRAEAPRLVAPSEVLTRVNELLVDEMAAHMFVTCLYAVLDPRSGLLRFANAGHNLPYVGAGGYVSELRATGMPLGLLPGMAYEEKQAALAPGDTLLLHSDGLAESHNPEREMFGFARVAALTGEASDGKVLIDRLLKELAEFTGPGWEQEDDITLITLHRSKR